MAKGLASLKSTFVHAAGLAAGATIGSRLARDGYELVKEKVKEVDWQNVGDQAKGMVSRSRAAALAAVEQFKKGDEPHDNQAQTTNVIDFRVDPEN